MKKPVTVTITGAAGQIGYALAFRVASGAAAGRRPAREPAPAGDHADAARAAGRGDGAERLRIPAAEQGASPPTTRRSRSGTAQVALLVGARPRGPGMERKDLLLANAQIFSAQGKAMNEVADRNITRAGGGQSRQHQCADRAREREGPQPAQLHRDDAPRSQPRAVAARGEDRRAHHRHPQAHDLGQPLVDAVSGSLARHRGRQGRRSRWSTRSGSRKPSSRSCSSAARPSSRRAAHRRRPRPQLRPSITSTRG